MVKATRSYLQSQEPSLTFRQQTRKVLSRCFLALLGVPDNPFSLVRRKWAWGSGRFFLAGSWMQPRALLQVRLGTSWVFTDADEAPECQKVQQPHSFSPLISSCTYVTHHTVDAVFTQRNGLCKWESHGFPRPLFNVRTAPAHRRGSFLLYYSLPITVLPHRHWHKLVSIDKWSWPLWSEGRAQ